MMHHGLIKSLRGIVEEAGVPKASIVEEARGLRHNDKSRSGDLVVLDFAQAGRRLIFDGVHWYLGFRHINIIYTTYSL